jgi:hypothetical protein
MSNIILSSNENSALLQTLNQSESKVIPSIYSTKEIYAPSSTSWYTITPKTGSATDGQSESWDLPKYGILQSIVLSYTKSLVFGSGGTSQFPAGDIFNVIDRVEYLSSSRILFTLYSEDIMAQLKDASTDEYSTVRETAVSAKPTAAASGVTAEYSIPIVFPFFGNKNTCPNLSFSEPTQVRIVYRKTNGHVVSSGAVTDPVATITTNLMLRYKMYSEADNAQLLSENYNDEMLNMLVNRNYRENPVSITQAIASAAIPNHVFTMELKNVDVINNYYFMVRGPSATTATQNELLEIKSVKLMASGQELCSLTANQLLYMKLSENGWPVNSSYLASAMNDVVKINRVAKIQTGLWSWDKDAFTNGWSQREMNNVVVEIVCDIPAGDAVGAGAVARKYTCYCQELTSCILSQSSNTGRNQISLAN